MVQEDILILGANSTIKTFQITYMNRSKKAYNDITNLNSLYKVKNTNSKNPHKKYCYNELSFSYH